jgi:hypothetical protein
VDLSRTSGGCGEDRKLSFNSRDVVTYNTPRY